MKSQVLAGGRGLGTFKNGFQGGVHIVKADQAEDVAGNEGCFLLLIRMWFDVSSFYTF